MKQILSLCAVLTLVMGASAAPQLRQAVKAELKPTMEHKLTVRPLQKLAAPDAIFKATANADSQLRAKAEVIESTYDEIRVDDFGTDVWFQATSTDGAYKWYVNPNVPMAQLEFGKVYTMHDMVVDYTFGVDARGYFDFASLECVLSNDNGKITMDCNIVADNGQEYHVYYKPIDIPTEATEIEVGEMSQVQLTDLTAELGAFQFEMFNADYQLGLCFASTGQIAGSYTTADLYGDFQFTYVFDHGTETKLYDVEATITSIGEDEYAIAAKLYAYDGNIYIVDTQFVPPTAQHAETITATNLEVDDSMIATFMAYYGYGVFTSTASNDEHTVLGEFTTFSGLVPGHYTTDDPASAYILSSLTIDGVSTYSGYVDVFLIDGFYAMTGEVLCWNSTVYTLDLSFTIPAIQEERLFLSSTIELADLCADLGVFQISGTTEDGNDWISFVFDADQVVSGRYTQLSQAYQSYCHIYIGADYYRMYTCDVNLDWNGKEFTLDGICQAGNILWTVELSGEAKVEMDPSQQYDDPDNDLDLVFTTDDIVEFEIAPNDYAYISAGDDSHLFATLIFFNGSELTEGVYEINKTFAPGTVQPGIVSNSGVYPTFYATLDEEGYMLIPLWLFAQGTVTVSYDTAGNISLDVNATNYWGRNGHVVINPQGSVAIENITDQSQKSGKFMERGNVIIRTNGRQYNGFGQMVK